MTVERRANARHPPLEFAIRVGMPVIDREHVALVRQLDRLNDDKDAQPGSEAFSEILSRLGRQINAHFDSEEEILRSCEMPPNWYGSTSRRIPKFSSEYARLNLDLMNGGKQLSVRMR
jgi:hypothetical protein